MAEPLQTFMDCIDRECAEDSGNGHYFIDGGDEGANCVSDKCLEDASTLFLGDGECWMCALMQMSGEESTESIRTSCTEQPETRYAYGGALGLAVLSKHPLGEAQSWLLPSTGWQRGLLRVPVELPNGAFLDVYCSELAHRETGVILYSGHYGGDATKDSDRWVAEQLLQAQRLVGMVQQQTESSGAKAVLAVTAYAGPPYKDGATEILASESPEVYAAIMAGPLSLVPKDYVPSCTQCVGNPVFGVTSGGVPTADAWTTHLLGFHINQDSVQETTLTFTDASYEVKTSEGTRMVPPSTHYGLRSVLRLTQ